MQGPGNLAGSEIKQRWFHRIFMITKIKRFLRKKRKKYVKS